MHLSKFVNLQILSYHNYVSFRTTKCQKLDLNQRWYFSILQFVLSKNFYWNIHNGFLRIFLRAWFCNINKWFFLFDINESQYDDIKLQINYWHQSLFLLPQIHDSISTLLFKTRESEFWNPWFILHRIVN